MEEYAGAPIPGQEIDATVPEPPTPAGARSPFLRRLWFGAGILAGAGCLVACDRPAAPPPLDPAVEAFLGQESLQVSNHGPGIAHYHVSNPREPWSVQLLRVDLSLCELGLEVLEAPVGDGAGSGRSTVTDLATAAGETLVAAVNGDFFTPEGLPVGTEVVDGVTRRIRRRPALAYRPGSPPWVGIPPSSGGEELHMGTDALGEGGEVATEAVGGFPLLLRNGTRVGDLEVTQRASFAAERHPRTAVGFDRDEGVVWVLVVDGRQPEHSVGMTLPELAGLFEALGVEDAINLDGGGSSAMVLGGVTVNRPSDAEGERPVVNALGIRRDQALCPVKK